MRRLFALGLTVCVVGSAAAQTEVVIRRPGQKDQVIRLDSAHTKEALARTQAEFERLSGVIKEQMRALPAKVSEMRLKEQMQEIPAKINEMRLQELGAEPQRAATLALRSDMLSKNFEATLEQNMKRSLASIRRQPHLGVVIATQPRESDKFGAYIVGVTPGSPADKAGILSGDIIAKVAGKSLTEKDPKNDAGPGVRLISVIATLTVGKPVEVELRRGTQNKTVKVTPIEDESNVVARSMPSTTEWMRTLPTERSGGGFNGSIFTSPETPRAAMAQGYSVFTAPSGTYTASFGSNGLFASYELAPLNDKLGAYFGTSEGVLVVNNRTQMVFEDALTARPGMPRDIVMDRARTDSARARAGAVAGGRGGTMIVTPRVFDTVRITTRDSGGRTIARAGRAEGNTTYIDGVPMVQRKLVNIGLEPGDVIVSVDGRKVTTPSQLMKIVGSYEHNDEFKLQIMRQKRAETLTVKMP